MNIALITGASSGMGMEFARQLDRSLHKTDEIWLLARRREPMEELARTLQHKTQIIAMDVTLDSAVKQFAEVLAISNPKITVLVNCAGVGKYGKFAHQSDEEVSNMMQLNIVALTRMTKLCLPYMRRGSKIIQLASGAAFVPQKAFAVYAASKAYVYSLSRALNKELAERGIRVMAVCPGPVNTPFLSRAYGEDSNIGRLKKLATMEAESVVNKAVMDCKRGKSVSVCGLPMKALYYATQGIQNLLCKFT
ncbi:MAG: SDR family NAD(P)-dependent oxidoreductase [Lachnospiraceae bacterium]|nr:SDR family NAD(P)-dependent oxidoreductase [Lachnospiraceae bacterium]